MCGCVWLNACAVPWVGRKTGAPAFIKLNVPRVRARTRIALRFVHFRARRAGHERSGEIITCGQVFPPRDILFAVHESTDHKPKRECSGAEIASEGAVNLPPFEAKAANFRVAAAARQACGAPTKVRPTPKPSLRGWSYTIFLPQVHVSQQAKGFTVFSARSSSAKMSSSN
jgi:hypothetical protein